MPSEFVFLFYESWSVFVEHIILIFGIGFAIWSLIGAKRQISSNTEQNKTRILNDLISEEKTISLEIAKLAQIKKCPKEAKESIIEIYLSHLEHIALMINMKKISPNNSRRYFKRMFKQAYEDFKEEILDGHNELLNVVIRWKLNESS